MKLHKRITYALPLFAALCLAATDARATTITFDTSSLVGGGLFSLDFQLTDGEGGIVGNANNTVTLSGFNFGAGGSALGTATLEGGASGDVSTTVLLTDTAFFNSLVQSFVPGSTISFDLAFTANLNSGVTPDQFSFYIFDSGGLNLPTTDPFGLNALVRLDLTTNPITDVFALQTTSSVPEPATMILLGAGLAGIALSERDAERAVTAKPEARGTHVSL